MTYLAISIVVDEAVWQPLNVLRNPLRKSFEIKASRQIKKASNKKTFFFFFFLSWFLSEGFGFAEALYPVRSVGGGGWQTDMGCALKNHCDWKLQINIWTRSGHLKLGFQVSGHTFVRTPRCLKLGAPILRMRGAAKHSSPERHALQINTKTKWQKKASK